MMMMMMKCILHATTVKLPITLKLVAFDHFFQKTSGRVFILCHLELVALN